VNGSVTFSAKRHDIAAAVSAAVLYLYDVVPVMKFTAAYKARIGSSDTTFGRVKPLSHFSLQFGLGFCALALPHTNSGHGFQQHQTAGRRRVLRGFSEQDQIRLGPVCVFRDNRLGVFASYI